MSYIGKTPTPAPLTANDIADGIITEDKLGANAVTTGKITDGTVAQADISDQAINEAKMQISNAPTNGYMLTAQSGNTGGMTWAEAGGGGTVLKVFTKMFGGGHSLSGTVNNGSATAVTGYVSPTITPQSSSSKFVIQWTISGDNTDHHFFQLRRNIGGSITSVGLAKSTIANSNQYNDWNSFFRHNATNSYPQKTLTFFDAPATASNVFYQLYYEAHGGTFYFGRSSTNPSTNQYKSLNSLIIWELDGSNITNTDEPNY